MGEATRRHELRQCRATPGQQQCAQAKHAAPDERTAVDD
jgi:hypothetical protein